MHGYQDARGKMQVCANCCVHMCVCVCVCVCVFQSALQSIQTGDSPVSGSQSGQDKAGVHRQESVQAGMTKQGKYPKAKISPVAGERSVCVCVCHVPFVSCPCNHDPIVSTPLRWWKYKGNVRLVCDLL